MTLHPYVGPPEIRQAAMNTARVRINVATDVARWAQSQVEPLVATFIVDKSGALWIADRRSEHIACSRGQAVQQVNVHLFDVHHAFVAAFNSRA